MVLEGSPELVLPDLVARFGITEISLSRCHGSNEAKTLAFLEQKLTIPLVVHRGNTLFQPEDFPFGLAEIPGVFSPFRRQVEKLTVKTPLAPPERLPPPPAAEFDSIPPSPHSRHPALPAARWKTGRGAPLATIHRRRQIDCRLQRDAQLPRWSGRLEHAVTLVGQRQPLRTSHRPIVFLISSAGKSPTNPLTGSISSCSGASSSTGGQWSMAPSYFASEGLWASPDSVPSNPGSLPAGARGTPTSRWLTL